MPEFEYEDLLPLGADHTTYRLLTREGVRTVEGPDGREFLQVAPEALRLLTETAMHDIAHFLRPAHLSQLRAIMEDLIEDVGIDEAYLDISELPDDSASIAAKIKIAIKEQTGLTCSVGIAANKLLAKIASDMRKPDGLTILNENDY